MTSPFMFVLADNLSLSDHINFYPINVKIVGIWLTLPSAVAPQPDALFFAYATWS